jgi:hypothetical protein
MSRQIISGLKKSPGALLRVNLITLYTIEKAKRNISANEPLDLKLSKIFDFNIQQ